MAHWHYQLMYHKYDKPILGEDGYYAVHEYYPSMASIDPWVDDGPGWTENPVTVDGNSVEDVKKMLLLILKDIDKHGVKDYESDQ